MENKCTCGDDCEKKAKGLCCGNSSVMNSLKPFDPVLAAAELEAALPEIERAVRDLEDAKRLPPGFFQQTITI